MDNKNLKYDDLTLMQFADGELDEKTANQVEKDLIDNVELQQRLEVFTTTRNALLSMQNTDAKIPDEISKMIDDYQKPKKDNKILYFLKGNPLKSVAASVIVGMFLGTQGVQQLMVASNAPVLSPVVTQQVMMASKGNTTADTQQFMKASKEKSQAEKHIPNASTYTYSDLKWENERLKELIYRANSQVSALSRVNKLSQQVVQKLIQSLSKNASIKKTVLSYENKDIDIFIVSDFKNSNNEECRLAQAQESYFVACLGDDNKWVINN